jgi:ribosome biogenesis GTPase
VQGFYYVQSEGRLYECRLRGILKRSEKRDNCVVGDIVEFSPEGTIDAIEERRNFLGRPLVANIDYILIQFAVKNPDLDFEKLNILLLNSFYYGISPIILINKIDLLSKNELQTIQKKLQFLEDLKIQVFYISRDWNIGIEDVRQYIKGATSAFGGPSGVGKSSVVNVLQSHVHMETGETSRKLTGRHTTKETRLIPFDVNGFIIDTPGFSSVDIPDIENSDVLISLFPEFLRTEQSCRFLNCRHMDEPGCAVKKLVEAGKISDMRYEFYRKVFQKLSRTRWNKHEK